MCRSIISTAFLAKFKEDEPRKMRAALDHIPASDLDQFYTQEYTAEIDALNEAVPEQFARGPDAGANVRGIVNMGKYFLGNEPLKCVRPIDHVAPLNASAEQKLATLKDVAESLLYTVRNNQFHAVKTPNHPPDQSTLETAYRLLLPLVESLLVVARKSDA